MWSVVVVAAAAMKLSLADVVFAVVGIERKIVYWVRCGDLIDGVT